MVPKGNSAPAAEDLGDPSFINPEIRADMHGKRCVVLRETSQGDRYAAMVRLFVTADERQRLGCLAGRPHYNGLVTLPLAPWTEDRPSAIGLS